MIILFLLIFFVKIIFVQSFDVVECSSAPTSVYSISSYTLLQTPDFPKTVLNGTYPSGCVAQFKADVGNSIWIVLFNGEASLITLCSDSGAIKNITDFSSFSSNKNIPNFVTNDNTLKFTLPDNQTRSWVGIQAAVIPVPSDSSAISDSNCPLNFQIFDFTLNPNLIVPILPTFNYTDLALKNCTWHFILKPSQTLKVVLVTFTRDPVKFILNLYSNEILIKNFNGSSINETYGNYASYYNGTNFMLNFIKPINISNYDTFSMLISAVETSHPNTAAGCKPSQFNSENQTTIYTNIDSSNGYPSYQQCQSPLTIPPNHEGSISLTKKYFESCCDKFDIDGIVLDYWTHGWDRQYILTSDLNEKFLTFNSDGNIQGIGFELELQTYECKCSGTVGYLSCDDFQSLFPLADSMNYCSNMICTYQIIPNATCPDKYIGIETYTSSLREESIDYMIVNVNGKMVNNIINFFIFLVWLDVQEEIVFSPQNTFEVQFHFGPTINSISPESKLAAILFHIKPEPKFTRITLDSTNPYSVLWLDDLVYNEAYVVCVATGTLEIFITHDDDDYYTFLNIALYDDKVMSNYIGNLRTGTYASSNVSPRYRKSESGCFIVHTLSGGNHATVLFRIAEESAKNCKITNNVFQIKSSDVSMESEATGPCEIMILPNYVKVLPSFWINSIAAISTSNNSINFLSSVNRRKLFQIPLSEISYWASISIYTSLLSVIIPPSSKISLDLLGNAEGSLNILLLGSSDKQKGIMVSPSYSGISNKFSNMSIYSANLESFVRRSTNLIVINVFGNPKITIDGLGCLALTKNQNLTITNSIFKLYYEENDPIKNGFLIEYAIFPTDSLMSSTFPTSPQTTTTSDSPSSSTSLSLSNDSTTSTISTVSSSSNNFTSSASSGITASVSVTSKTPTTTSQRSNALAFYLNLELPLMINCFVTLNILR